MTAWGERLAGVLRGGTSDSGFQQAITTGRIAKFAEDYPLALERFEHALVLARAAERTMLIAVTRAALHRSETLARLRRFDEAAQFVNEMRTLGGASNMRVAHLAYMDFAAGMVEQGRGDINAARTAYESALNAAKASPNAPFMNGAEGRALGSLADLYLRDGNASYAAHLLRDALPKLGASSDLELSGYFFGLLGQAITVLGQEAEGLHLIQRALTLAEQFHYRLYERHWGVVLGVRALDEGRFLDARAHLQRIARLFDPDHPTPTYVLTQTVLSRASMYLRDQENALAYAEAAVKGLEQPTSSPVDPPVLLVDPGNLDSLARGALGAALRAAGRSAEALPHLQAALSAQPQDHVTREQIDVLRALAAAQADCGDFVSSMATYARAIEGAQKLDDPLGVAQCRRDLGLIHQKNGQNAQALHEWTTALAIYEDKSAYSQIARLYCDIANLRKAMGASARALKDYEEALLILNKVDRADLATRGLVLSNAANAYAETGDAESADAFYSEAIQIAEKTNDKPADSTRCGNYGWFLILVGRPRRAIATLERALRISQQLGMTLQAAVQTDNLGLAYDSLSEYHNAVTHHRAALALIDPAEHPNWAASFKVNLANTLLSLGEPREALTLIDEALAQGRISEDTDLLIAALTAQARAALITDDLEAMRTPLDEAILLARRAEARRRLADLLYLRSQLRARTGDRMGASSAWDEAHKFYTMLHMPQAKITPTWLEKVP